MQLHHFRTCLILLAIVLLIPACGRADPAAAPADVTDASPATIATPVATAKQAMPVTAFATPAATPTTGQHQSPAWLKLPAGFAIRTAAQAKTLALELAGTTLDASHPRVANVWLLTQREMAQGSEQVLGEHDDPLALIWWVDFDDDDYAIPRCPAPLPGTTRENCGSARSASFQFFASNGQNVGLTVGRSFALATIAESDTLRTEGEAIAAALQDTHGVGAPVPQVVSVRSLTARQWSDQRDGATLMAGTAAPDLPLWDVELNHANIVIPCLRLDTANCSPQHADILFNARAGDFIGVFNPLPIIATPTP